MFLVVLLEKVGGVPSAWWFGEDSTLCTAALAGERAQVGQVRLQVGVLKSGLRVSEKHCQVPHPVWCLLFSPLCSVPKAVQTELDPSGCHQDTTTSSHSENKNSSLVLVRSLGCGQKTLDVSSPGRCAQRHLLY